MMDERTRVVLADDCSLIREVVATMLLQEQNYEVIGEARLGAEALQICELGRPDILILDAGFEDLDGPEVIRSLRDRAPEVRSVVYAASNHPLGPAILQACPNAFVSRSSPRAAFREALHLVTNGGCYFTANASEIMRATSGHSLSGRELEIVRLVARGLSSKEVASRLNLSTRTVENHRARVMAKLKLRGVTELTRYAVKNRLVDE